MRILHESLLSRKKTDNNAVIPLSLCSAQVGREKSQLEVSLISTDYSSVRRTISSVPSFDAVLSNHNTYMGLLHSKLCT